MTILLMIYEFFKTGLLAVGGGLATLPFLHEMAENYDWFTEHDVLDMIAIGESTPGPIGVNMATYAGVSAFGVFGGVITTLALVAPSVIVILMIAKVLERFSASPVTRGVFAALRPASAGLIAAAAAEVIVSVLFKSDIQALISDFLSVVSAFDFRALILGVAVYFGIKKFGGHPILYLLGCALVGVVLKM